MIRKIPAVLMMYLLCGVTPAWSLAASTPESELTVDIIAQATERLTKLESDIASSPPVTREALIKTSRSIASIRQIGEKCTADSIIELKILNRDLQLFDAEDTRIGVTRGEGEEGQVAESSLSTVADSPKTAKKRRNLEKQQSILKENLVECNLLAAHGESLARTIQHHKESILARRLLSREKNLVQIINGLQVPSSNSVPSKISLRTIKESVYENQILLLEFISVVIFGIFAGLVLRRQLKNKIASSLRVDNGAFSPFVLSFGACISRYAPLLMAMTGGSLFIMAQPVSGEDNTLRYTFYDATWYAFILLGIRSFLQPCKPAVNIFYEFPSEILFKVGSYLKLLALLLLMNWLLPTFAQNGWVSEGYGPLIGISLSALTALIGVRVISLARHIQGWFFSGFWLWFAVVFLLGGLLTIMLGYFNLGNLVIRGTILTPVSIMTTLLMQKLLKRFLDDLLNGETPAQQKLRSIIGLKEGDKTPGVGWLRFLGLLVLWGGLGITLLHIWDMVDAGEGLIQQYIFEGLEVSGIRIIPARILMAVMFFAIFLACTRWIKHQMTVSWLAHTHLDEGAKDALVTSIGYLGVALAVIVALSLGGVDLSNLSIIIGALSVGIGFGLQNVVNNFVSGLILLVERPVKRGDWIVVNGTEGIVRRISIRSTLLETFDHSDVIVPNSELISGQVTNWMLKNRWGRVRIPIGVAYGTDIKLATKILLNIADEHKNILKNKPGISDPSVVFHEFGNDSLNLELRANVTDVNLKKRVQSDINYAIEEMFRKEGISIPFAQRDINIENPVKVEITRPKKADDSKKDS